MRYECSECMEKHNLMNALRKSGLSLDAIIYYIREMFPNEHELSDMNILFRDGFDEYYMSKWEHDKYFIDFSKVQRINIINDEHYSIYNIDFISNNQPIYSINFYEECYNTEFINKEIHKILNENRHIDINGSITHLNSNRIMIFYEISHENIISINKSLSFFKEIYPIIIYVHDLFYIIKFKGLNYFDNNIELSVTLYRPCDLTPLHLENANFYDIETNEEF